jgi:hypothetical protein
VRWRREEVKAAARCPWNGANGNFGWGGGGGRYNREKKIGFRTARRDWEQRQRESQCLGQTPGRQGAGEVGRAIGQAGTNEPAVRCALQGDTCLQTCYAQLVTPYSTCGRDPALGSC